MSTPAIRSAEPGDLPALTDLYNHYVVNTWITFDTKPFTAEERRGWFEAFSAGGPHRLLVAEDAGRLGGYASSRPFHERPAYATSVETTIYLAPDASGRGLGGALYRALLDALVAEPSLHRAYGGIALPNAASIALHERLGFRLAGTYREVGFKLGAYRDVSWYEKDLSAR